MLGLLLGDISFDCGAKDQLLTLRDINNYIISNLFYKQTHCTKAGINTNGRQINTLCDRIDKKVRQTELDQKAHPRLCSKEAQCSETVKSRMPSI